VRFRLQADCETNQPIDAKFEVKTYDIESSDAYASSCRVDAVILWVEWLDTKVIWLYCYISRVGKTCIRNYWDNIL
jgi:hypothetical protein